MKLDFKTNFPEVQRSLRQLRSDIGGRALVSAMNKTMAQAQTQMGREITSEYRVTSAYVRERLRLKRAAFRAGQFSFTAELIGGNGKKRSANMIAFLERSVSLAQARKRGKEGTLNQLRFQVRKTGGKKIITGAFIGNKGRTVFIRTGKDRLPIKAVSTIDVAQMFNQKRINRAVVGTIRARFPTIFASEARFYVSKFNAR
ncbi:phage tail protein [Hydrogenophaga sp. ANAO-22]|jgi:hypothetical protein|uniref:phage tail protein n=1 Tax=Hydrogenophaga sp. ANAO-22 TaxID=3166645 RepID=UPI0036D2445F